MNVPCDGARPGAASSHAGKSFRSSKWTEEGRKGTSQVRDGSPMNVPGDGARRRRVFPRGRVVAFEQIE